jgi:hypothetical protein
LYSVSQRRVDDVVAATEDMLWGSLGEVYRRCGRSTCRCATGEKHGPVYYLTRNEGGRTRNIYIPEELRSEVERGVAAYRDISTSRSWIVRPSGPMAAESRISVFASGTRSK